MRMSAAAGLLVAGVLWFPGDAVAQSVLVRVTDGATAQPLQGALVTLDAASGTRVGSALTDLRGQYLFRNVPVGSYSVTAELIGYGGVTREVAVGVDDTPRLDLILETRAIELEGISVESTGRCELRAEAGLTVSEVWEEVRKALEATRFTEESGVYQYRTRRYSRNVEEETGRVSDQRTERGRNYLRTPYESRPAEDLLQNGFVQDEDNQPGGEFYYAPDASVLLSDLFLDTHCMRLKRGEDEESGLVGLEFEPIGGRRVPDIRGTLWVDPVSWQLRHLEYTYTNMRPDIETHGVGGRVGFQKLPNGTWIVPEWEIRAAWLALGRDGLGRETIYQHGFHEEGATVLTVREPGGDVLFSVSTAALDGVVLDEGTLEPVQGAVVALEGAGETETSDRDGRFRFTEIPEGDYTVRARIGDAGGPEGASQGLDVTLSGGGAASVVLMMPGPLSIHLRACEGDPGERPRGSAVLAGRVLERASGVPLQGARVSVEWDDFGTLDAGYVGQRGLESRTGPDGEYRACAVPRNSLLRVTASWGGRETVEDTIRTPDGGPGLMHDFEIGAQAEAVLAGEVVGWSDGEPVPEAAVRLVRSDSGDDPITLTTNREGRFALPDAVVGSYRVEVSALAYRTIVDTVDARPGRSNYVRVRLPAEAFEIEGVVVEVEARIPRLEEIGFYGRRREGQGIFIDADEIRPRLPLPVTQLFDGMTGIQVGVTAPRAGSREALIIQGCLPAIFIDGVRVRTSMEWNPDPSPAVTGRMAVEYLSELVNASQVSGIEVYRDQVDMPSQYAGRGTECGVVLVWTH